MEIFCWPRENINLKKVFQGDKFYWYFCNSLKINKGKILVSKKRNGPMILLWKSEGLLFTGNPHRAIFQLCHVENKLIFNEMIMMSALYKTNTLNWIFIVLAHWNNTPRVDMSLHSGTFPCLRANQSALSP